MIYVSIRSSYDLERGPALSYWTERLVHYYQGFEWSACLNYAIAYFMKHQNASTETWYSTDPELLTEHFVGAKRNSSFLINLLISFLLHRVSRLAPLPSRPITPPLFPHHRFVQQAIPRRQSQRITPS